MHRCADGNDERVAQSIRGPLCVTEGTPELRAGLEPRFIARRSVRCAVRVLSASRLANSGWPFGAFPPLGVPSSICGLAGPGLGGVVVIRLALEQGR